MPQDDEGEDADDGEDDEDGMGPRGEVEDDAKPKRKRTLTKSCSRYRRSMAPKILPMHPNGTYCTSADGPDLWCCHPEDFMVRGLHQMYIAEHVEEGKPWMASEQMRALLWRYARQMCNLCVSCFPVGAKVPSFPPNLLHADDCQPGLI